MSILFYDESTLSIIDLDSCSEELPIDSINLDTSENFHSQD